MYGRLFWAIAADDSLNPALTVGVLANFSWTDTAVDTKGTLVNGILPSGIVSAGNPFVGGKQRYLGNEWLARLSHRFTQNVAFDLVAAYLWSGHALDIQGTAARDVSKISARLRITF